jgi:hypothetical protein
VSGDHLSDGVAERQLLFDEVHGYRLKKDLPFNGRTI